MATDARRYWESVTDGGCAAHLVCEGFLHTAVLNTYFAPAAWLLTNVSLLLDQAAAAGQVFELAGAIRGALAAPVPWAAGLPKPEDARAVAALKEALQKCQVPGDVPALLNAMDDLVQIDVVERLRALRQAVAQQPDLLPHGGRGTEEELYYASLPPGGDERDNLFV
jgi:hypothetical protein